MGDIFGAWRGSNHDVRVEHQRSFCASICCQPSSPKEKTTIHHQITSDHPNQSSNPDVNMEDSKTKQQSDNKKEPEMAPGDFLQYKGSRKNLKDEEEEDLGHYELEEYGHDFIQLLEALNISQFGDILTN